MTSLSFKFPSVLQISMSVPASLMEDAFTIVSTSLETTDARATMASVWPTMDTTAWVSYRFFQSYIWAKTAEKIHVYRRSDKTFC